MGRHFEVRAASMAATAKKKSAIYMRASKEIYMAAKKFIWLLKKVFLTLIQILL